MYRYVDFHINSVILNITIPPATPTTTVIPEGGMIISINEENKDKIRSNNLHNINGHYYSNQRYKYKLTRE